MRVRWEKVNLHGLEADACRAAQALHFIALQSERCGADAGDVAETHRLSEAIYDRLREKYFPASMTPKARAERRSAEKAAREDRVKAALLAEREGAA